jgi:cytochrome c oxidase cbb3-type subunit 3
MIAKSSAIAALACLTLSVYAQQRDVDAGRQLYTEHCFVCHGQDGESIPGVNLRSGQIRRASTDDELSRLILGGIPGTGMPPTNLTEQPRRNLVGYIRSWHQAGVTSKGTGDAARGQAIFEGKGACLGCHRANGKGSRLGPDLSEIGVSKLASYLEQSLVSPNDVIAPQNRFIHAVTKQGVTIYGRRLNEDTHFIQVIDDKEHLVSISKSDLQEYQLLKTSPMPSYKDKLSSQEIADVVSYLLSLKGAQ